MDWREKASLKNRSFSIRNFDQLRSLASEIASLIYPGLLIILQGPLGVGKTELVRTIMKNLGYSGIVRSPSFTLINEYRECNISITHVDLYRIGRTYMDDLGLMELLESSCVIVEWGDLLIDPVENTVIIKIGYSEDFSRDISISCDDNSCNFFLDRIGVIK